MNLYRGSVWGVREGGGVSALQVSSGRVPTCCHSHGLLSLTQQSLVSLLPFLPAQPEWMQQCGTPLALLSPPLPEPAPSYQAAPADVVVAAHDVSYGKPGWTMPRCSRRHPDATTRAAVFAAALLDGRAIKALSGEGAGECGCRHPDATMRAAVFAAALALAGEGWRGRRRRPMVTMPGEEKDLLSSLR